MAVTKIMLKHGFNGYIPILSKIFYKKGFHPLNPDPDYGFVRFLNKNQQKAQSG